MVNLFYINTMITKPWDQFTDGVQGKITYFVFSLAEVGWMVGLVCLGLGWMVGPGWIVGLKMQGKKVENCIFSILEEWLN